MADIAMPPPSRADLAPRAPSKGGFIAKLGASVARHPSMSLAIIVVLAILVVGMYVYYHGLFFLGPYAGGKKALKKVADPGGATAGDGGPAGDPETERLIASINQH